MWVWLLAIYLTGMAVTLALLEVERGHGRLTVTRVWLLVLAGWPVVWVALALAEVMHKRAAK